MTGLYVFLTILVAVVSYGLGYFNGETNTIEKVMSGEYDD
jgi:hypothetical protein